MRKYVSLSSFVLFIVLFFGISCMNSQAQTPGNLFTMENLYVGGGVSQNSVSGFEDATGFQLFGGLELPLSEQLQLKQNPKVTTYGEMGFMDSGKFGNESASGLWFSGVVTYDFNQDIAGLARLGFDAGDDDGVLYGVGGEYSFHNKFGIRGEYVERSTISSLQINGTYDFR